VADDDAGEKTEEPTAKRRSDAREEGNVPKSTEVNTVVVLLAAVVFLRFAIPKIGDLVLDQIRRYWAMMTLETAKGDPFVLLQTLFQDAILIVVKTVIPVALVIMIFGVIGNIAQVGLLFSLKSIQPKLSKINPISGMQRLFSMRAVVDTIKNIFKLIVVGAVAWISIKNEYGQFIALVNASTFEIAVYMLKLSYAITIKIIFVLLIIAVIDWFYQKFEHEKKMKMSKQEVKEEHKQQDGDPKIKGRIRQLQREMAMRRMMSEVPKATVVVTNPTHLSIAIQYDEGMKSPIVVAKGVDHIAMKIRDIAKEHDIPLYEDVPLARSMYDKVEPGDEVPIEFYNAVAEVLAFVYKMQGKV